MLIAYVCIECVIHSQNDVINIVMHMAQSRYSFGRINMFQTLLRQFVAYPREAELEP